MLLPASRRFESRLHDLNYGYRPNFCYFLSLPISFVLLRLEMTIFEAHPVVKEKREMRAGCSLLSSKQETGFLARSLNSHNLDWLAQRQPIGEMGRACRKCRVDSDGQQKVEDMAATKSRAWPSEKAAIQPAGTRPRSALRFITDHFFTFPTYKCQMP